MTSFTIEDTKTFMSRLLKGEVFDNFCLREFNAETFAAFVISGQRNTAFYDDAEAIELEKYCLWQEIRPYAFMLIKGTRLPKSIKIVFSANQKELESFNNAAALFLNITFSDGIVNCTTGCSQQNFALDKSLDNLWDDYVIQFFKDNGITIERY